MPLNEAKYNEMELANIGAVVPFAVPLPMDKGAS